MPQIRNISSLLIKNASKHFILIHMTTILKKGINRTKIHKTKGDIWFNIISKINERNMNDAFHKPTKQPPNNALKLPRKVTKATMKHSCTNSLSTFHVPVNRISFPKPKQLMQLRSSTTSVRLRHPSCQSCQNHHQKPLLHHLDLHHHPQDHPKEMNPSPAQLLMRLRSNFSAW